MKLKPLIEATIPNPHFPVCVTDRDDDRFLLLGDDRNASLFYDDRDSDDDDYWRPLAQFRSVHRGNSGSLAISIQQ